MKNRYKICDNYTIIYLDRRNNIPMETLIDTEDLEKVIGYKYKWNATYCKCSDSFYARASIYLGIIDGKPKYTTMKLNYFIMGCPEDMEVDHKDNNSLDNRRNNLRVTEKIFNLKNRKSKNSNNTSGYRNVTFDKRTEEWVVQLQVNKRNKVLKRFPKDQLKEAGAFAEEMRKIYYGEFAGKN